MTPLLASVLRLSQHRAQGTSLAVAVFTALAALIGYSLGGHVDLRMAALLVAGSVIGAPLGARATRRFPAVVLRRIFGGLLLLVGIRLFLPSLPGGDWLPTEEIAGAISLVLLGFASGFASGFLGVGGGVILVPALVLLAAVPQHLAQGVSLLFVIPTAVAGSITHSRMGNVERSVILPLAATSVVSALLAAHLASALPGTALRVGFGALVVVLGARLVLAKRRDV